MKQQAVRQTRTRLTPFQKRPGSRLGSILFYLALFILLDLILMQGPSTFISQFMHAVFNNTSLPAGQSLMPSVPDSSKTDNYAYHGLLNYVSLNGLFTTLLAIVEWRIGENLLKSTYELFKQPSRKLWKYGRRKIRSCKLAIQLAYLGLKNSRPVT